MRIEETSFFKEAIRFIGYGSSFGWHERNAGNISLRLSENEVASVKDLFDSSRDWVLLPYQVSEMSGEFVFTTVSGSYFIDMHNASETKFCICEISADGMSYKVVWGDLKPTSELCGHLMSLAELKKRNGGRAVYHCHPANIIALSYLLPLSDKAVSEAIWASETECAFVLPKGIGVIGFNVPGSPKLAKETAEKVAVFDIVLWAFHGVFSTGNSIAEAFGLAHAVEKAAEIRLKIMSSGYKETNTITPEQQKEIAEYYGFDLNSF